MSPLFDLLLVALVAVGIYSAIEAHSFSLAVWRRGITVFRHVVEGPIVLEQSFIGRETTTSGVTLKLIDFNTCLFRRAPHWSQLRTIPLLGEISFGPRGYVVLGRLPFSQVLGSLALAALISAVLSGVDSPPNFMSSILPRTLAPLLLVAALNIISVLVERQYIKSMSQMAICSVESRK